MNDKPITNPMLDLSYIRDDDVVLEELENILDSKKYVATDIVTNEVSFRKQNNLWYSNRCYWSIERRFN